MPFQIIICIRSDIAFDMLCPSTFFCPISCTPKSNLMIDLCIRSDIAFYMLCPSTFFYPFSGTPKSTPMIDQHPCPHHHPTGHTHPPQVYPLPHPLRKQPQPCRPKPMQRQTS